MRAGISFKAASRQMIADHLQGRAPLAVTAEQAREVVRLLEAAALSAAEQTAVAGPWGKGPV